MNTTTVRALILSVLGVAVLSCAVIVFFQYRNAPNAELMANTDAGGFDLTPVQEKKEPYEVKPIVVPAPDVIPEGTDEEEGQMIPPPAVKESIDPDGNVVQTPNWEDQKKLKADTDLEDHDKEPEYVGEPSKPSRAPETPAGTGGTKDTGDQKPSSTPSNEGNSTKGKDPVSPSKPNGGVKPGNNENTGGETPHNGAQKTIDGKSYTYVEGFGWVKDGDGNQRTEEHAPTTGNKIGH